MSFFKCPLVMTAGLLVVLLTLCPQQAESQLENLKKCWDQWSRCTGWSSAGTGILWQSCDDRCKCKGFASGKCVSVTSQCPLTKNAYQCQCSGRNTQPAKWWCGFK